MHKSSFYSCKAIWEAVPRCGFRQCDAQCVPASLRWILSSSLEGLKVIALSTCGCACSNYCNCREVTRWSSSVPNQFVPVILPDTSCRPKRHFLRSKKPGICKLARNFLVHLFLGLQLISPFYSSSFIQPESTKELSSRVHKEFAFYYQKKSKTRQRGHCLLHHSRMRFHWKNLMVLCGG